MKLHIGDPVTGFNKCIPVDDENKYRIFLEKRIGQEVSMDSVGPEYKGYVVKITGGCDKSGFPMKQGVLTSSRVRLLIPRGALGFQRWRGRRGERRRKSVRGCVVSSDIAALNMIIVKKGEKPIEGLNTTSKPRTLGPKRASKIRKLFALKKHQDIRKYVIRHQVTLFKKKHAKNIKRGPKIQRLITPERLRRKTLIHKRSADRKFASKVARKNYEKLLEKRKPEDQKLKEASAKKQKATEKKPQQQKKPTEKKQPQKKKDTKKPEVKKEEPKKKPTTEQQPKKK